VTGSMHIKGRRLTSRDNDHLRLPDALLAEAAFEHVRRLGEIHDHLTALELKPGFIFDGERIPLIHAGCFIAAGAAVNHGGLATERMPSPLPRIPAKTSTAPRDRGNPV
jgi:hypothetical protein